MNADLIVAYDRRVPRYTSYPTAPHFTAAVGAEEYAAWLGAVPPGDRLSLYIHVPFCAELCLYCGCHTTVVRRYAPVAAYADLLRSEMALVAGLLPGRHALSHLHWGGGTPTILSADDLTRLGEAITAHFDFAADAEIAIEIDPRTFKPEQAAALAGMGVNRASLGVQDFDPVVQRVINRVQSFEQTLQVADWLRAAGIAALNLDLMYGLPHQTVDSVIRSVEMALRLAPQRVALFGYAHVPWMKRHQALLPEASLPKPLDRFAQMRAAAEAIRSAGYVAIGLDHFALPTDSLAEAQRTGRLRRNFQGYTTDDSATLIGLGTSAIGRLRQGFVQNAPATVAYRQALSAGRLATVRGVALAATDRLRADVIERLMCDLAVDLTHVAQEHARSETEFDAELSRLDEMARDGLVARDGYRISVPEEARPLIRNICAVFDQHLAPDGVRHSQAV